MVSTLLSTPRTQIKGAPEFGALSSLSITFVFIFVYFFVHVFTIVYNYLILHRNIPPLYGIVTLKSLLTENFIIELHTYLLPGAFALTYFTNFMIPSSLITRLRTLQPADTESSLESSPSSSSSPSTPSSSALPSSLFRRSAPGARYTFVDSVSNYHCQ